jgi:hypothetical protein
MQGDSKTYPPSAEVPNAPDLRPMGSFDPSQPAMIRNHLTRTLLQWRPEWADRYRLCARQQQAGIIWFDGLLLDGWELASAPEPQTTSDPAVSQPLGPVPRPPATECGNG